MGFWGHPRKENVESGALPDAAADVDRPAGLRHDAKHGGKAEAAAFPFLFRGEERFEDVGLRVTVHPASGVSHRELHIRSRRQRIDMVQRSLRPVSYTHLTLP